MDLGDRMKLYEGAYRHFLPRRVPVIIRLDGRAFHTLTKDMERPFDKKFSNIMCNTATYLVNDIQNARVAYVQSDEISLLLIDYNKFDTQQWFDGNIQKMTSVSASMASSVFSLYLNKGAQFDSRVFTLPESDVVNYFIWRQQDWTRNSIQMVAQSLYSHKELHKKNCTELQEMIFQKGQNWNDLSNRWKRGACVDKDLHLQIDIPEFSKDRKYIQKYMTIEEE